MSPKDLEGRKRMLQATLDLLSETEDPETITMRQIADRAGVGLGLINYHFQNKDNLFKQAIDGLIGDMAGQWERFLDPTISDPLARLKQVLKINTRAALDNAKYMRIIIRYDLLQGDFVTSNTLLPVLREIYGNQRSEPEIRMVAFTLVTAMQVAFLRGKAFRNYSGVDLQDPLQSNQWVDATVDTLVVPRKG